MILSACPVASLTPDYRRLFESSPGSWLAIQPDDPFYTIVTASSAFARMLRIPRTRIRGCRLFDILSRAAGPGNTSWIGEVYVSLRRVMENRLPDIMRVQKLIPGSGAAGSTQQDRFWRATNVPVLDEVGGVQYILHSIEEITGQQRTAAALRRAEQRLRVAIESAHVGVWEYLPRSRKVFWSPRSASLHGMPESRFLEVDVFFDAIDPADRERVRALATKALNPYGTGEIDVEYRIAAGPEVRWVAVQGKVFFERENGFRRPVRATGTMLDITARKCADEERERLLAELQRSNRELAHYSHVVSHDLQAPLRNVRGFAELLARHYKDNLDSTAGEYISHIVDGADAMQRLIQELLQYAQVGAAVPALQRVSLNQVFSEVSATLQPAIDEHRATISCDLLPGVQGDPLQMRQLLQNLLGNALKYGRPGVRPEIAIRVRQRGEDWLFAVEDNGMGIEAEFREIIFQPMRRLHGPEIPGTGIGLAVCRQIVERHQGQIWVESIPGMGSTFNFTLPR